MSGAHEKITIVGDHEPKVIAQLKRCVDDEAGVRGVLCADGHYGYSMPVGGVVAYVDAVSPSGVGYDIACGNLAVRTPLKATDVIPDVAGIMDRIVREIAFGIGRKAAVRVDDSLFADPTWTDVRPLGSLKDLARSQLGTVGSGNHYVDLFADENDDLWIGVHFGSRGFGHRTASGFLNLAAGRGFGDKAPGESMDQPPTMLALASPLGADYFAAMQLAGRYAYAGREAVVNQVLGILGTSAVEAIHNHHNFCVHQDAIIPTTTGPKRMADLVVGDTIYAFDETTGPVETRVVNHWSSGRKPIYRIQTLSHSLRVSGDHPVLVIDVEVRKSWRRQRFGHYAWRKACDLRIGDVVVGVKGYYPTDSEAVSEDQGRIIGAFLGDGYYRRDTSYYGHLVGLAIGGPQDGCLTLFQRLLERVLPEAVWKNNAPGVFGLSCTNRSVYRELHGLGVVGDSHSKRVPRSVFGAPVGVKRAFLSGYIDSDGSVSRNTKNLGRGTVCTVNYDIALGVHEIAVGVGLNPTPVRTVEMKSNFTGTFVAHRWELRRSVMATLDLWNDRRRDNLCVSTRERGAGARYKSMVGGLHLPVNSLAQRVLRITLEEDAEVFDLEVDHPSHSFIAEGLVVHNCWREVHGGEEVYVVRKGSTPNAPGQRSFIGGSMGDDSVIVEGLAVPANDTLLRSTVHGAGRVMSRSQAAGSRRGKNKKPGLITRQMMSEWTKRKGVVVRGGGPDESPHVYRRLPDVLAQHASTIRVVHTLRPIGVAMAGADEFDPYKD